MHQEEQTEFDYDYEYDENGEIVYYAERPNKTQIKKEMAELFSLAEEIAELSNAQIINLELPDNIYKAILDVAKMPHKGARKRQLKYITGQLYKLEDISPIVEKVNRIKNKSVHAVREHHIAERWRDRLIAEGHEALTDFLDEYPQADRQQLRQLVRNAQKEAEANKPLKSSRMLYRYIKELLQTVEDDIEEDYEEDSIDEFDDFDDDEEDV